MTCQQIGAAIVCGERYEEIKRDDSVLAATCVALEPVTVKGIRNAVKIYEVPWKQAAPEVAKTAASTPAAETSAPAPAPK